MRPQLFSFRRGQRMIFTRSLFFIVGCDVLTSLPYQMNIFRFVEPLNSNFVFYKKFVIFAKHLQLFNYWVLEGRNCYKIFL